jgi:hypothetical protein
LKRLRDLEARVIAGDLEALTEFISNKPRFSIALKNPINEIDAFGRKESIALCSIQNHSPEDITFITVTAKKYFPDAEIRQEESQDGKPVLVLIGVDAKTANAAVRLEREQQRLCQSIEKTAIRLKDTTTGIVIPEKVRAAMGSTDLSGLRNARPQADGDRERKGPVMKLATQERSGP